MKTRIMVALVCAPVLLLIILLLPLWCFALCLSFFTATGAYEFMRCASPAAPRYFSVTAMLFAAMAPLIFCMGEPFILIYIASAFLLLIILVVMLIVSVERGGAKITLKDLLCAFFAGIIFPSMLGSLVLSGYFPGRAVHIILPLITAFTCDSCAYFAGVFLGKYKLAPSISPNKTIEGALGGVIGGTLFTLIYGVILIIIGFDVSLLRLAVCGIIGSAVCELGDLCYSAIKREFGVKDYGNLFPGHGGVLDRCDGLSFVAPATLILMLTTFPIG